MQYFDLTNVMKLIIVVTIFALNYAVCADFNFSKQIFKHFNRIIIFLTKVCMCSVLHGCHSVFFTQLHEWYPWHYFDSSFFSKSPKLSKQVLLCPVEQTWCEYDSRLHHKMKKHVSWQYQSKTRKMFLCSIYFKLC